MPPESPPPPSSPPARAEAGLDQMLRDLAGAGRWAELRDAVLARPAARLSGRAIEELATAAARLRDPRAGRRAALAAIGRDLPPGRRASVARLVGVSGAQSEALLVLLADLDGAADSERRAGLARNLRPLLVSADALVRDAATALTRRIARVGNDPGERLPQPDGYVPSPPARRAFPLEILAAPGVPAAEAEVFARLDAGFEEGLGTVVAPEVLLFRNVFVSPQGQVWRREGVQVGEDLVGRGLRPLDPEALAAAAEAPELAEAEFGLHPTDGNFYHWLVNHLPGLDWQLERPAPPVLLHGAGFPGFAAEALDLIAGGAWPRLAPAGPVLVRRLYFSRQPVEVLADWRRFGPVYDRLIRGAGAEASDGDALLYISRRDAERRSMRNEAALEEALVALGFRIVRFAGVPLAEQIRVIRSARVIVSPHGAALAHLAMARPGTRVVELMPIGPNPSVRFNMARLSRLRGHRHTLWLEAADPLDGSWTASLDALLPVLRRAAA